MAAWRRGRPGVVPRGPASSSSSRIDMTYAPGIWFCPAAMLPHLATSASTFRPKQANRAAVGVTRDGQGGRAGAHASDPTAWLVGAGASKLSAVADANRTDDMVAQLSTTDYRDRCLGPVHRCHFATKEEAVVCIGRHEEPQ